MRADIEAKRQCIAEHCEASLRHTIEEEHLYYLDELDKSERMGRRRMARGA